MIFPEKLHPGDMVALTAPSSPISGEEAERCVAYIEGLGYTVKAGDSLYSSLHGYMAGTGRARAAELNAMFADNEVKAIFCVRGGDTSARAIEHIDLDMIKANSKIFVGYSDITSYHTLFSRAGLVTFHGPMVRSNMIDGFDDYSREAFWKILEMGESASLENPPGVEIKAARPGIARGRLTGGNLSLITSMLGTPYEIEAKGRILFIEDVDEPVRHVDRMLHHLKFSGKLGEAAGVIVGSFEGSVNKKDPNYGLEELILDFFADYGRPVLYNVQAGHCFPTATLPIGAMCEIDAQGAGITFYRGRIR